jgi:hypothetical protein
MKYILVVFVLFVGINLVSGQGDNMFTLSGGYTFGKMSEPNADAALSGYRVNGLYEYVATEKFIHGFAFGWINTKGSYTQTTTTPTGPVTPPVTTVANIEGKLLSIALYYAPKFIIGSKSLQGFIKGAAGLQFSTLNTTNMYTKEEATNKGAGFYGGLGLGVMKTFKDQFILNLEYEWAYMNMINKDIQNTNMNSVMMGFGWKF